MGVVNKLITAKTLMLIFAVIVDITMGEYPSIIHPVVYMGKMGKVFDRFANTNIKNNLLKFISGGFAEVAEIFLWIFGIFLTFNLLQAVGHLAHYIFLVYLLKSTFSIKGLFDHVKRCYTDNEEELRKSVSMIVSRNTSELDKPHLYSAAIESLAENISDSITGPLFYYVLFGLIGAFIYRIVNTYDALFGYRNERYEWFGKFCARFDDLLNYIPARLTALFILLFNPKGALKYLKKYRKIKINATYPMSAFAGVLSIGLEKMGYYKFDGPLPVKEDVKTALKLYRKVVFIIVVVSIILSEVLKIG